MSNHQPLIMLSIKIILSIDDRLRITKGEHLPQPIFERKRRSKTPHNQLHLSNFNVSILVHLIDGKLKE